MNSWDNQLQEYLRARPLFLSVLRAKEAYLYKDYLPFNKPVLDYGCGDGFFAKIAFSQKLKTQNSKLKKNENIIDIGLDIKESRIEEVEKRGVYNKIVIYDGVKIPFNNNHFGTIVSNSVLEHVDGLDGVLFEIHRVLKAKGKFLTTVMARPWEDHLFGAKIFGDFYRRYMRKKQVHVNLLSRGEWDMHFKKAGFKVVKTIGHLDAMSCQLLDIFHYLSIPSLITYKLFGRWVLSSFFADIIYPRKLLIKATKNNVSPDLSGALFYELEKK